ncbi:unnamed protein product [Somion occarium]|uniref:Malate dehydrogenase n=1 Tax=Somion occarium TaxID=3059160 RepID=A0ABP1CX40_9APHY
MMFSILLTTVFASLTLAAPSLKSGCDVSHVVIPLPAGQTQLVAPTTTTPRFIGIAAGVQNYTCAATGTYTNVGAVAEIFDVSCLDPGLFVKATDIVSSVWEKAPKGVTPQKVIKDLAVIGSPIVLGQHYFITNPITGTGLSPKWDFTSASLAGHPDAFVVGARTGDLPSPTDPTENIDWLSLDGVQGNLADQIFRIETRKGQPPSSCTPGTPDISVRYASQYWFFGGSF